MSECAFGEEVGRPFVRIAELEIDPAQLERFKGAVREQMVRVGPGVQDLYAVSVKDDPSSGYSKCMPTRAHNMAHLETPHFKKFRAVTDDIVKSRKLIDTVPIVLGARAE
jgi:hypothetical protein